jgi:hypothetical protein
VFERLDNFLIAKATSAAHRFQRLTGLTTYFIARIGVAISALSIIVEMLNYLYPFLSGKTSMGAMIIGFLCLLLAIQYSIVLGKAEESVGSNVKPAILLPFITRSYVWRIFWLWGLAFDLVVFFAHHSRFVVLEFLWGPGYPLGLVIFFYFVKVDPLPPGKSKVREWIEGFTAVREQVPSRAH